MIAWSRRARSVRIRASSRPCSFFAAWYSKFSERSPNSRAVLIAATTAARRGPSSSSSSARSASACFAVSCSNSSHSAACVVSSSPLEQAQPVLDLGDAELELVPVVAGDEAEFAEDVAQPVPRALAHAQRVAAPARGGVAEQRAHLVDPRADEREQPLEIAIERSPRTLWCRSPGSAPAVTGLVHAASSFCAGAAVPASRQALVAVTVTSSSSSSFSPATSPWVIDSIASLDRVHAACRAPASAAMAASDSRRLAGSLSSAVLAARVLGVALHQRGQQRRGDEDRADRTDHDPDHDREREVLQRRAAEDVQRRDRQQRDHRREERPPQHLPHRHVADPRDRSRAASAACSRAHGRTR